MRFGLKRLQFVIKIIVALFVMIFPVNAISSSFYRGDFSHSSFYGNETSIYGGMKKLDINLSNNPILISPLVDSKRIYAASNDNNLFAIDKESGEIIWSNQIEHSITSQLIIINNQLLVGTENGAILFFDVNNGNIEASIKIQGKVFGSFISYEDFIVIGNHEGLICSIHIPTKITQDCFTLNEQIGPPLLFNETIIVPGGPTCCGSTINMYSFENGIFGRRVSLKTPLNFITLPILVNGVIYGSGIGTSESPTSLISVDIVNKTYKRLFEVNSTAYLSAYDGKIFFADGNFLYAINNHHELIWEYASNEIISRYASLSTNSLYISTHNKIHSVDINDGKVNWIYESKYIISTPLVLDSKGLYFGTMDGRIIVLE